MLDRFSPEKRSRIMSRIRSKDTGPEMIVRRYLHSRGLRYRLHCRDLPGSPDLVMHSRRVVIFVNGCFWHGHEGCSKARLPSTRHDFWREKISNNVSRDKLIQDSLCKIGWRVIVMWSCGLNKNGLEYLYDSIIYGS